MSFFNTNAIAIMLKPLLAKWIEPLEENGTLDRIAADVQMLSDQGAIPALAELVANMKEHNALLRELLDRIKADGTAPIEPGTAALLPFTGAGTSGHDGIDRVRMLEHDRPD